MKLYSYTINIGGYIIPYPFLRMLMFLQSKNIAEPSNARNFIFFFAMFLKLLCSKFNIIYSNVRFQRVM